MKKRILFLIFMLCVQVMNAQNSKTDANIMGHVLSGGKHLPFATVFLKGTTTGTSTDETGHFLLTNLPVGDFILEAQMMGYKPQEKTVEIRKGKTIEVKFNLEEDTLGLEAVVVTGDRNEKNRRSSSVIVNTVTPKIFNTVNAVTLSDGLNFTPGVRMEDNCENCGFTQVRMDGMEGPYSQILINGRAIFSGLAGVYGLEMIPSNMLERIEVVRGGGSALYGSNAIAGTINLILKDPAYNSYEIGTNDNLIGTGLKGSGGIRNDYSVDANATVVSPDDRTGMSIYGFHRNRQPFDANGDGYSELVKIDNTTFGTRLFHRFGMRNKLTVDFFNIKEDRRGGDKFDYTVHEADIAEAVSHDVTTGAVTYEQFLRTSDVWSIYFSGQNISRDSYYGADQSLEDYGKTHGFTCVAGSQYNMKFERSDLTFGIEDREEWLKDMKLGYPDIANAVIEGVEITDIPHTDNVVIANQKSDILGAFAQYEAKFGKLDASVGGRFDHYGITDNSGDGSDKSGNVFSPRVTLKYDLFDCLQARLSYSHGYRAPQIYDEDLHVESSGVRQVIHRNDPDLKPETSHSLMASLDFNRKIGHTAVGLLAEGFYTQLNNAFVNDYGTPDEDGVVIYTRTNAAGGAIVKGVNLELNVIPGKKFSFKSGLTMQSSSYRDAQEFDEKRFFRTPNNYGYWNMDWKPVPSLGISSSADYTGKMLVPYFGPTLADPDEGELRESDPFFDLGIKVRYNIRLDNLTLQVFTGVKNILDSYQKDFDEGMDRDSGYIYGPSLPRTVYFGIRIGNSLN